MIERAVGVDTGDSPALETSEGVEISNCQDLAIRERDDLNGRQ